MEVSTMKRLICFFLTLALVLSVSGSALASELTDATFNEPDTLMPRYRETVKALRRTPVYKNPPQLNIDNPIIAYASVDSTFNFLDLYTIGNIQYYYVSIIDVGDPNLASAKGYIAAADCQIIVG